MPSCPALLISAPSSGAGKTSATAAIARFHTRQGRHVRVFKTGPDHLDPMVLARASGHPVCQLDLFMRGLAHCQQLSALGLQSFRPDITLCGVVANRVGSAAHGRMVAEGLPADLPLVAALPRDAGLSLPERHLSPVQAMEQPGLDAQLDAWADAWGAAVDPRFQFQPTRFTAEPDLILKPSLAGLRIAVAQDAAFSFIYPAHLDCLRALGAEVSSFAPIRGQALPACDALWLPGGYTELHAPALRDSPRRQPQRGARGRGAVPARLAARQLRPPSFPVQLRGDCRLFRIKNPCCLNTALRRSPGPVVAGAVPCGPGLQRRTVGSWGGWGGADGSADGSAEALAAAGF